MSTPTYEETLMAAGAKVLAFSEFGSYQGDWWGVIEFGGGLSFVHGSYGSCSGCDQLRAEFDDNCSEHDPDWRENPCPDSCPRRLKAASIGAEYVAQRMDAAEALAEVEDGWSDDRQRPWIRQKIAEHFPADALPTEDMALAQLLRVLSEGELRDALTKDAEDPYSDALRDIKARLADAYGPKGRIYLAVWRTRKKE